MFPLTIYETTISNPLLLDETFGPVLYVVHQDSTQQYLEFFNTKYPGLAKPLAAYIFTTKKRQA